MDANSTALKLRYLSQLVHISQGTGIMGAALAHGWVSDRPGSRLRLLSPLFLLLAGICSSAFIYLLPEAWQLGKVWAAPLSDAEFLRLAAVSFLLTAAGLSELMANSEKTSGVWKHGLPAVMVFSAAVYFFYSHENPDALLKTSLLHFSIALPLAAGAILLWVSFSVRNKALSVAWITFALISSLQLITFREPDSAFVPVPLTFNTVNVSHNR